MNVRYLIIVAVVLIAGIDVALIASGVNSISFTFYDWSKEYPAIAFMIGFVCGHIFWPVRFDKGKKDVGQQ